MVLLTTPMLAHPHTAHTRMHPGVAGYCSRNNIKGNIIIPSTQDTLPPCTRYPIYPSVTL